MTERERMRSGRLYQAGDRELSLARDRAKELCYDYNALRPSDRAGQAALLRRLLGKVGRNPCVLAPFWCDYGENITLGDEFFANHGLTILDCAPVTFGDHVFIAPDCGFHTAGHPVDAARRNAGWEYARPITVGDDVWFGAGVQVLPGVTIGCDCVIGAVSKMIKPSADRRRKNDRNDAEFLARMLSVGNIVEVWVPDDECEAARDLARALDDAREDLRRQKQRLSKFLLRHGLVFDEKTPSGQRKSNWTGAY